MKRPPVMESALCAQTDPEVFFLGKGESPAPAKQLCGKCMDYGVCYEWIMSLEACEDGEGIIAGMTLRQRRKLRIQIDRSA